MNIGRFGKIATVLALSTAIVAGGLQVGGHHQDLATVDNNQPQAELVIEDAYAPATEQHAGTIHYDAVHEKGIEAIQKETDASGLYTIAPMKIASHLGEANVDGTYDQNLDVSDFTAVFSDSATGAAFEVACTNDGIGDALIDGSGPLTVLENGLILQKTGANEISSEWIRTSPDGTNSCKVRTENMTLEQTVEMAGSLHLFTPSHVNGAYILN